MKRIVIAIAAGVGLALAIILLIPPSNRPGVTKANFDRIEDGMTERQAEAILGPAEMARTMSSVSGVSQFSTWNRADGATVQLTFRNNFLTEKQWQESTETVSQMIRRWFGSWTQNRQSQVKERFEMHSCRI